MAIQILTRSLLSKPKTLTTSFLFLSPRRFYSAVAASSKTIITPSLPHSLSFLHRRLLLRALPCCSSLLLRDSLPTSFRSFSTTTAATSSLNDPNSNDSNWPPKEFDGCDFEHWLVAMEPPKEGATRDEIIDSYIKTLAKVVGSEEEARMKIYSASTMHYYSFGVRVCEELSLKIKELPGVRWVCPDFYQDVKNKDYGGEPFINGQAVPYDPKYHEEWVRQEALSKKWLDNKRKDRVRDYESVYESRRLGKNIVPAISFSLNNCVPPPNTSMPPMVHNLGGMPPNYRGGGLPPPNKMAWNGDGMQQNMDNVPPNQ